MSCAFVLSSLSVLLCLSPLMQALGCILYLLCFKQHPFEEGAKLQIVNGKYSIPQNDVKYTVYHDLIRTSCQPLSASLFLAVHLSISLLLLLSMSHTTSQSYSFKHSIHIL